jgi:RHS repeat-associated protein
MVFDRTGALASVKRHDYLPFGEELSASQGLRTTTFGYGGADGVRQKFTSQERDNETGLDYMHARYSSSAQGRFTSADTFAGSTGNPQSLNRYAYVGNNPLNFSDPSGHDRFSASSNGFAAAMNGQGGYMDPDNDDPTGLAHRANAQIDAWIAQEAAEQQAQSGAQPTAESTAQSQGDTGSQPESESSNPALGMQDRELALLFGDCDSIARGSDTRSGELDRTLGNHFYTADGTLNTIHLYGDSSGNKTVGVYLPQGFTNVVYEGGSNNQVRATNPQSKEVLVYAHVAGVGSQADVDRNLRSGKTNSKGSRYLGQIGGPGGDGKGYRHSHITLYRDTQGRSSILAQKNSAPYQTGRITDFSGYGNMVHLLR